MLLTRGVTSRWLSFSCGESQRLVSEVLRPPPVYQASSANPWSAEQRDVAAVVAQDQPSSQSRESAAGRRSPVLLSGTAGRPSRGRSSAGP